MTEVTNIRYYYVDEAGDLNLFNKKGKIIVGEEGTSNVFMLGLLYLPDPLKAKEKLEELRNQLLADPRFKDIPSMQPASKKTALFFHAKNDHRLVRQEVFNLLPQLKATVLVAIRRKLELAQKNKVRDFKLGEKKLVVCQTPTKLSNNDIYDDLVTRLFQNMLHKADENRIIFARLGKSERREALADAIKKAKKDFNKKWEKGYDRPTNIDVKKPSEEIGLQIIDYYLWALQRLYERNDDSFFRLLADNYSLIIDLDDKRNKQYGEYYKDSNPLTLQKLKPLVS